MINKIILPKHINTTLREYGNSSLEKEVCGLGLGQTFTQDDQIITRPEKFIIVDNVTEKLGGIPSEIHYVMDPGTVFNVYNQTRLLNKDAEFDLSFIFHTHPRSKPVPSITDAALIAQDTVYLIYSPLYGELKAYGILKNENGWKFEEIEIEIEIEKED